MCKHLGVGVDVWVSVRVWRLFASALVLPKISTLSYSLCDNPLLNSRLRPLRRRGAIRLRGPYRPGRATSSFHFIAPSSTSSHNNVTSGSASTLPATAASSLTSSSTGVNSTQTAPAGFSRRLLRSASSSSSGRAGDFDVALSEYYSNVIRVGGANSHRETGSEVASQQRHHRSTTSASRRDSSSEPNILSRHQVCRQFIHSFIHSFIHFIHSFSLALILRFPSFICECII